MSPHTWESVLHTHPPPSSSSSILFSTSAKFPEAQKGWWRCPMYGREFETHYANPSDQPWISVVTPAHCKKKLLPLNWQQCYSTDVNTVTRQAHPDCWAEQYSPWHPSHWAFDKACGTRHEFSPLEQASNPMRIGLVVPVTGLPLLHRWIVFEWLIGSLQDPHE